ncbi:MAG: hypothetical protein ACJAXR_001631 [Halopseudomonas sp.]|uniref:hypothetical protein n=1 Tax=Halopseudomonas sp. TaxID=2901191 RepID=UPI0039E3359A
MRQPDIEIYLREEHLDALTAWLNQQIGPLELKPWHELVRRGTLTCDKHQIALMIIRKAAGKWASVWFDSAHTPWETDLDCARAIFQGLQEEARCSVGGWSEEEDDPEMDRWIKVNASGEVEFTWAIKA